VLLDPPPHLVPCAGGELDDVECVEDGSVVDGVLVPVERVQGRNLHPARKAPPRSISQFAAFTFLPTPIAATTLIIKSQPVPCSERSQGSPPVTAPAERRRPGPRRVLSEEEILDAALELLDEGGPNAASVRGVAAKVGVAPNKDTLASPP
jgi:hypothetical protein